ncbi:hypothetical protein DOTSEDRAFT_73910 [Dothistroma septosporum NZE10]|uniref:Uncharacterized protein n=1 Tax=Dothistroma septosporum (strain NZE10 / CBS 128990) TaxID=675120 RepID=N1PH42_DOTSN|nr:hypothetical protein DOTSEDRAFT_73910 [Dothistroma septosporum NZE10]
MDNNIMAEILQGLEHSNLLRTHHGRHNRSIPRKGPQQEELRAPTDSSVEHSSIASLWPKTAVDSVIQHLRYIYRTRAPTRLTRSNPSSSPLAAHMLSSSSRALVPYSV